MKSMNRMDDFMGIILKKLLFVCLAKTEVRFGHCIEMIYIFLLKPVNSLTIKLAAICFWILWKMLIFWPKNSEKSQKILYFWHFFWGGGHYPFSFAICWHHLKTKLKSMNMMDFRGIILEKSCFLAVIYIIFIKRVNNMTIKLV